MVKKMIFSFFLVSVVINLVFTGCSGGNTGGKYGEVKEILTDYLSAINDLDKSLESAKDGKTAAKAFTTYVDKMKKLGPKVERLPEMYPELGSDNPPAELKDLLKKFDDSEGLQAALLMKMMKYMDDPDVMKALEQMEDME